VTSRRKGRRLRNHSSDEEYRRIDVEQADTAIRDAQTPGLAHPGFGLAAAAAAGRQRRPGGAATIMGYRQSGEGATQSVTQGAQLCDGSLYRLDSVLGNVSNKSENWIDFLSNLQL